MSYKQSLKIGTKIESEHKGTIKFIKTYLKQHNKLPPNKQIFTSIAKDHLKGEDPKYYTKLRKAGL
jgi:sulfur relay (sulfurtransferase) DsrC/TusE family protein